MVAALDDALCSVKSTVKPRSEATYLKTTFTDTPQHDARE
jgi:hypothetical protein